MLEPPTSIPDQRPLWDQWYRARGAPGDDPVHLELRRTFLGELGGRGERLNVLDLGCGQGHDVVAFVRAGHAAWGLDFSVRALRRGRRALPWWRPDQRARLTLRKHDLAEPLPFPDQMFHGVYSHLALHYFDDGVTRRIFRDIFRVTRPGGLFTFSVKSVEDPCFAEGVPVGERGYVRNGHLRHYFTDGYVAELLRDWEVVKIEACQGRYASPETSAFIRAVARRPRIARHPG